METEEVIVTGVREERVNWIPKSISVITAREIEQASTTSIVDLLSREANLNIRSFTGNDKFSGIDIRGMGDTFGSNVVVLVDGIRINAPDLSGPDFSAISLAQIERIEVIRGGGGVRYGNGAVGGVINIITKGRARISRRQIGLRYGSFNELEGKLNVAESFGAWFVNIDGVVHDSDGFRNNGSLRKNDFSAKIAWRPHELVELELGASHHADRYGLPGPVSRMDFKLSSLSRRKSNAPNDRGETNDRRYHLQAQLDFQHFGKLSGRVNFRNRENTFVIGASPLLTIFDQQSKIKEQSRNFELSYVFDIAVGDFTYDAAMGYTFNGSQYSQRRNGRKLVGQSEVHPGRINNHAGFVSSTLNFRDLIAIDFGYRKDVFNLRRRDENLREFCDFETIIERTSVDLGFPIGVIVTEVPRIVETNCRETFDITNADVTTWRNEAYDLGAVFSPVKDFSIFFNYSRSFRNPNVDELVVASNDLGPQRGEHWDVGARFSYFDWLDLSIALFRIDVEDEIFLAFDPLSSQTVNTNLPGITLRRGGELEIEINPTALTTLWANYGHVKATSELTGATVPLVPEHTFSLSGEVRLNNGISYFANARYVSARFDGNDFDNRSFKDIDPYTVVDVKATYRYHQHRFELGLNNIFNEIYATSVFSDTFYAMPERNFYLGANFKF